METGLSFPSLYFGATYKAPNLWNKKSRALSPASRSMLAYQPLQLFFSFAGGAENLVFQADLSPPLAQDDHLH